MRTLFIFVIFTSYAAFAGALECGPGEVINDCPLSCNEFCPKWHGESNSCTPESPDDCPPPKCVCPFNMRRAANGICIPTIDCPPFECSGPNEEYNPCPSYCPSDDCSQATPNGVCPFPGLVSLVLECSPACRCKPTYWRSDGVCVPYHRCNEEGDIEFLMPSQL